MKKLNKLFLGLASVGAVAAPIAAVVSCGTTSSDAIKYVAYSGKTPTAATSFFVTDGGKIDDKTFNESVWEGLKAAGGSTITDAHALKPTAAAEIMQQYNSAKTKGANLIVASGFNHATAISEFSQDNSGIGFVFVDGTIEANKDGKNVQQGNVASIVFNTAQASFLEGVAAAVESSTGTAATHKIGYYGGMNIPSVTAYINGFKAGVQFYNANNGTATDVALVDGGFVGDFNTGGASTTIATKLVSTDKVDFVLPVGGPQYLDVVSAIKGATGSTTKIIGVDTDLTQADSTNAQYVFGSILKQLKQATTEVVTAIYANPTDATKGFGQVYTGTLANNLVGITQTMNGDAFPGKTWADVKLEAEKQN